MVPEQPRHSLSRFIPSWKMIAGVSLAAVLVTGAFSLPRDAGLPPEAPKKIDAKRLHDLAIRAEKEGRFSEALDLAEKSLGASWNQPDLIALLNRIAEQHPELKTRARQVAVRYETMVRLLEKGPITAKDVKPTAPSGAPPSAPGIPTPGGQRPGVSADPNLPRHLPRPGGTGVPRPWKPGVPRPEGMPR